MPTVWSGEERNERSIAGVQPAGIGAEGRQYGTGAVAERAASDETSALTVESLTRVHDDRLVRRLGRVRRARRVAGAGQPRLERAGGGHHGRDRRQGRSGAPRRRPRPDRTTRARASRRARTASRPPGRTGRSRRGAKRRTATRRRRGQRRSGDASIRPWEDPPGRRAKRELARIVARRRGGGAHGQVSAIFGLRSGPACTRSIGRTRRSAWS